MIWLAIMASRAQYLFANNRVQKHTDCACDGCWTETLRRRKNADYCSAKPSLY